MRFRFVHGVAGSAAAPDTHLAILGSFQLCAVSTPTVDADMTVRASNLSSRLLIGSCPRIPAVLRALSAQLEQSESVPAADDSEVAVGLG